MENKYSKLSKEDLIAEVKARREKGSTISVDLRSSEEVLAAALVKDDKMEEVAPTTPTKPPVPSSLAPAQPTKPVDGSLGNQLERQPELPSLATQPAPDAWEKSFLAKNTKDGGLTYQVLITDDELKPYKARIPAQASGHPGKFWEGNKEEYTATFEKL